MSNYPNELVRWREAEHELAIIEAEIRDYELKLAWCTRHVINEKAQEKWRQTIAEARSRLEAALSKFNGATEVYFEAMLTSKVEIVVARYQAQLGSPGF